MLEKSIYELVREAIDNDDGEITQGKYVDFNMRETLEKIDAYYNSKHISGETDIDGRDKPFPNINKSAVNIWYRATDIDRKNIRIIASKRSQTTAAFIATLLLQKWMRKARFGIFLNKWGRSLARYCSSIPKFIEKDGELIAEVKSWNKMIVDPIDFENNLKIEKIELTPAQLKKRKEYDQEMVSKLLEDRQTRQTTEEQDQDTRDDYIELYEVHGELSLAHLTGYDGDEDIYRQQTHVITFMEGKEGEWDDYTLYAGKEAKEPNMITHLIEEDGRTLGIGPVEDLFDAQWMVNHNAKNVKDLLDFISKLSTQTADTNLKGKNTLSDFKLGEIIHHADGKPLEAINLGNQLGTIQALEGSGEGWKRLGREIVGVSEAMLGEMPKSGTAWRQTRAILQENYSLFEVMTENKALALEEMMREHIIPYLKKQMDTTEEISEILEDYQIKQIDSMYVPNEAIRMTNTKIKEMVLSGLEANQGIQDELIAKYTQELQDGLNSLGKQRFIKPSDIPTKTWKDALKDFEWEVIVDASHEDQDTQAMMETLGTAFQVIGSNPAIFENPKAKMVFDKILTLSGGISPLELDAVNSAPQPAQPTNQPVQQPAMAQ
uniref:Portal protein n=1 Tax=viral metagenome TaxID=1070528 RepID=A0A6H1ZRZ0_9ZZZZ